MTEKPIDPLQRVFVPEEKRDVNGNYVFKTIDHTAYIRGKNGSIRRVSPKVNGKVARKARARVKR